jgi:hypothetical protein
LTRELGFYTPRLRHQHYAILVAAVGSTSWQHLSAVSCIILNLTVTPIAQRCPAAAAQLYFQALVPSSFTIGLKVDKLSSLQSLTSPIRGSKVTKKCPDPHLKFLLD